MGCKIALHRAFIRMMKATILWRTPRIHGELLKLGIEIGETSLSKYTGFRFSSGQPTYGKSTMENCYC